VPHTVRAAVLREFRVPLVSEELELDPPKAGEILVRMAASGVCHSDLHVVQGIHPTELPVVLGHEGAGVVEEVGPGVDGLEPGDHVLLTWLPYCGRCRHCARGWPNRCENVAWYDATMEDGTCRFHRDGARIHHYNTSSFSERSVVPARTAIPVDRDLSLTELALMGCAVMTGVGAVLNTARVRPGDTVAVVGCGGVGLNVVQGAVIAGASRIIAVDLLDNKLDYAGSFGASDLVNGAKGDPVQQVLDLTGGVDYVFEAIGNVKATEQAIQMAARGGTITLVGMAPQHQAATFDPLLFTQRELRMLGCFYGSFRPKLDFLRYVDMVVKGQLKVRELISRRYALDEINEAYDRLGRGEVARSVISFPV
jgi:S-(hydroxymethyl)glutathione dehydrogenase / alcohol dehydrogenase